MGPEENKLLIEELEEEFELHKRNYVLEKEKQTWEKQKLQFQEEQKEHLKIITDLKLREFENRKIHQEDLDIIDDLQTRCNEYRRVANNLLTHFALQGLLAQHNIEENKKFRDCFKKIAESISPKLDEPKQENYLVIHEFTVKDNSKIFILNNTKLEVLEKQNRRKERKRNYEEAFNEDPVEIFRYKTNNTLLFWNLAKTVFPKIFYGIASTTSKKLIIRYLSKTTIDCKYFLQPNEMFKNAEEAVQQSFTPDDRAREQTVHMFTTVCDEMNKNIVEPSASVRTTAHYTNKRAHEFIDKYLSESICQNSVTIINE